MRGAGIEALVAKIAHDEQQIQKFQDLTLRNGHALREAINSGKVSFAQFQRLLSKGERFREWVRGVPANADLLQEFYEATTRETWMEQMPVKGLRWLLATWAEHQFPPVGGSVVAAGDIFFLERIAAGWRPNMFVERELRPMVQGV